MTPSEPDCTNPRACEGCLSIMRGCLKGLARKRSYDINLPKSSGPLTGIKFLEIARIGPAPMCCSPSACLPVFALRAHNLRARGADFQGEPPVRAAWARRMRAPLWVSRTARQPFAGRNDGWQCVLHYGVAAPSGRQTRCARRVHCWRPRASWPIRRASSSSMTNLRRGQNGFQ